MARRLYCPNLNVGDVVVEGPEAHHGRDVLRLRSGDAVEIFDGQGRFAEATVHGVGKSQLALHVDAVQQDTTIRPWVSLATAVPKFAHQETLVRMGTEIGVSAFCPIICERSSVREQFRTDKWRRWTIDACRQCGSNVLPEVREAMELGRLLTTVNEYDSVIYGDMVGQRRNWPTGLAKARKMLILVGPEGGFTDEEIAQIHEAGAAGLRIGHNILRIETAGVAICSVIQCLAGMNAT